MSEGNLYTVYHDLRNFLPGTKPMVINQYDNTYILAHIITDDSINVLKITHDYGIFGIELSNFRTGYSRALVTRDPFKSVENLFIEINDLDGLSIESLNAVVSNDLGKFTRDITNDHVVYGIRDYIIDVKLIDESFEVTLSKSDYTSKPYRFKTAYEVTRLLSFIITQYIQIYFDERNDMMLDLILDLYVEFGYRNVFIRHDDNREDISIRLITSYGSRYFTYDNGKIFCEFYHELDGKRTHYSKTVDICEEALDWAYVLD
jgi:hypothetical protein